jgi:hypothetical protein
MYVDTFLDLVRTIVEVAMLVVAILALKKGDPPRNDGSSKTNCEN